MDKDYMIVGTFVEGSMIGIVCEHVGYHDLKVEVGEFRGLSRPLEEWERNQLSHVLRQVSSFMETWQPDVPVPQE